MTSLRNIGDVGREAIEARDMIEEARFTGPRILPSGPLLAITGGHGAPHIARIATVDAVLDRL